MIICERAGIEEGMDILERGCGWGSLSLWMAEKFPHAQIHSISNSTSQRMFIQQQADAGGLTNLQLVTADMNEYSTDQTVDRIVSVEGFEHMRNHQKLMRRILTWLRPQ
jgi:cyclopropane-fatty-acyl-phospholipid synthase